MTDDEARALGLRAMACKGWRWKPGMLLGDHGRSQIGRVHRVGSDWVVYFGLTSEARTRQKITRALVPDLNDPATVGCLLALVREAWVGHVHDYAPIPVTTAWAEFDSIRREWSVVDAECIELGCGNTEAEALVSALEAAP